MKNVSVKKEKEKKCSMYKDNNIIRNKILTYSEFFTMWFSFMLRKQQSLDSDLKEESH